MGSTANPRQAAQGSSSAESVKALDLPQQNTGRPWLLVIGLKVKSSVLYTELILSVTSSLKNDSAKLCDFVSPCRCESWRTACGTCSNLCTVPVGMGIYLGYWGIFAGKARRFWSEATVIIP